MLNNTKKSNKAQEIIYSELMTKVMLEMNLKSWKIKDIGMLQLRLAKVYISFLSYKLHNI